MGKSTFIKLCFNGRFRALSLAIRGAESLCGAELITSGLTEESRDRDRTVSLLEPGVEVLKNLRFGHRVAALQSQVHNSVCISAATRSLSAIEVTSRRTRLHT